MDITDSDRKYRSKHGQFHFTGLGLFFAGRMISQGLCGEHRNPNSLVLVLVKSNPFNSSTNSHQFLDNLTYIRGKHTFKAGADLDGPIPLWYWPPMPTEPIRSTASILEMGLAIFCWVLQ